MLQTLQFGLTVLKKFKLYDGLVSASFIFVKCFPSNSIQAKLVTEYIVWNLTT